MTDAKKEAGKDKKKKEEYVDGIKMTVVPCLFGLLAGIISFFMFKNDPADLDGFFIALIMSLIQKWVYPFVGTRLEGIKDWLYITFLTIFCWFIAFTLLLDIYI